jgi:hypothetical protein
VSNDIIEITDSEIILIAEVSAPDVIEISGQSPAEVIVITETEPGTSDDPIVVVSEAAPTIVIAETLALGTIEIQDESPSQIVISSSDGAQGPPGPPGGDSWLTGTGAPSSGLGVVDDFYLDTSTSDIYLKTGVSTWTLVGSIELPHQATDITLDTLAASNTVVGSTVQEYVNRFNEPSVSEAPTYNLNGTVSFIEYFSSPTQVVANRIFRVDLTYDANLQPLTETWRAYSKADGTTILKTVVESYTWAAGRLTNKTQVTT